MRAIYTTHKATKIHKILKISLKEVIGGWELEVGD
jgi:hypothetical protein